ncbi:hypothetical protein PGT21_025043 [Puccinia graminis f. sp. tritici]|uniref:Uncharacterized protein n=1 Tax=Puccinia graminis f. sp. tritici TaxID=56615 RepID=A0A5B0M942_PUCGR|nr:hypothetical protein PGT21_025043 [Puccinia graminis f. sp. tritici]KAA1072683.1 hypothetical protein PGTUg99_017237 [Puccinia graminis f. sp. tritici]
MFTFGPSLHWSRTALLLASAPTTKLWRLVLSSDVRASSTSELGIASSGRDCVAGQDSGHRAWAMFSHVWGWAVELPCDGKYHASTELALVDPHQNRDQYPRGGSKVRAFELVTNRQPRRDERSGMSWPSLAV